MSTHLCITVRWISGRFHGFIDGTEMLEWPPSPFRLFQALVAGAHRYGMDATKRNALVWIERQRFAPDVLAPPNPCTGIIFDHWVPDNDNLLKHRRRSIRKFHPRLLEESPVVHYVWRIDPSDQPPLAALDDLTSTLSSLGWAVDHAYAIVTLASVQQIDSTILGPDRLSRFRPVGKTTSSDGSLRVPKPGSVRDLEQVHFVNCTAGKDQAERRRKKWPKVFDHVLYTSMDTDIEQPPICRPKVVFKLLDANEDTFRYPHAKLIHISGMVRHAAVERMIADPPSWIEDSEGWVRRVVHGKRDESSVEDHQQFSYVPLPSIGHEHADAMIRNVMIVAPLGMERELNYLAERLSGEYLKAEDCSDACTWESRPFLPGPIALQRFKPPAGKFIANCYLATADTWQTVTPIILPGNDDHRPKKTEKLIQRALQQSGIDTPCEFIWQSIPFFKNTLSAHKRDVHGRRAGYFRPTYLKENSAVHLRIRFGRRKESGNLDSGWLPAVVKGPIVIGAGRHCGFGLLAALGTRQEPA